MLHANVIWKPRQGFGGRQNDIKVSIKNNPSALHIQTAQVLLQFGMLIANQFYDTEIYKHREARTQID